MHSVSLLSIPLITRTVLLLGFDLGRLSETLHRNRKEKNISSTFSSQRGIRGRFFAEKTTLFAGNGSKLVSLCPDDRLSIECIFPFCMYFTNPISVFILLSLSLDITVCINFKEKAEFCS